MEHSFLAGAVAGLVRRKDAVVAYLAVCHAHHPVLCLGCWAAASYQVSQLVFGLIAAALGLPYRPIIVQMF